MVDAAINLGPASTLIGMSGIPALSWLDRSLADGGSIYRVGDQGLERRIDAATRAQFDATLDLARNAQTPSGSAAMHLAEAWTKTCGVNPEPPAAVLLAVKAVEDVPIHLIIPKDDNATLGKVINALQHPVSGHSSLPGTGASCQFLS